MSDDLPVITVECEWENGCRTVLYAGHSMAAAWGEVVRFARECRWASVRVAFWQAGEVQRDDVLAYRRAGARESYPLGVVGWLGRCVPLTAVLKALAIRVVIFRPNSGNLITSRSKLSRVSSINSVSRMA